MIDWFGIGSFDRFFAIFETSSCVILIFWYIYLVNYRSTIIFIFKKSSMDLQNEVDEPQSKSKEILLQRYSASKTLFMYMSFVFFLNYFLVGAKFWDGFWTMTLLWTYVGFVTSFFLFLYFFWATQFAKGEAFLKVSRIVLGVLYLCFLIPLFF